MKYANQGIALFLIVQTIMFACNKEKSQADMWECHHEMTWDSLSTKNALIGVWEWEYINCLNTGNDDNDKYRGLSIEFKSDNTLNVIENGQVTQTSHWKVVEGDADLFEIDADPSITQLYGRILFCDKRVEFNHSYIDGCDNYFTRKE
ncbi:MAG: hypothetical protein JNM22_06885 [Saprospiraceae bacterium]|nr:hypothetical protein [Saprospiraceae bacterium]